jgi:hypothetical protein
LLCWLRTLIAHIKIRTGIIKTKCGSFIQRERCKYSNLDCLSQARDWISNIICRDLYLRWEVVVRFVDVGGIVDHQFLSIYKAYTYHIKWLNRRNSTVLSEWSYHILFLQYRPQIFVFIKKTKIVLALCICFRLYIIRVRIMVLNTTFTIPGVTNSFGG